MYLLILCKIISGLRSEVGDSWNSQARKMEPHTVSLNLRRGNSVKTKHLVKMSSDIHYPGLPQIPYARNFSDINMSSSETLTAQDCWLDTFFFSPFYNSWRQVWFWIMMSGIIPINIGQWIRRFKGKNRKARRSFENDILAHSQIKTISRHSESRRSQKQWKGIVFFSNLHKTILFAHCSLTKGTVVVAALLKINQMHNF